MRASATSSTDVLFADNVHWEKKRRFLATFWRLPKSCPLAEGQRKLLIFGRQRAKAESLDSRFRGNDDQELRGPRHRRGAIHRARFHALRARWIAPLRKRECHLGMASGA